MEEREQWALGLGIVAGLMFLAIGVRFMVAPDAAYDFFGLADPPGTAELGIVIGLRDAWLALLVIGLAWWREWRALALLLGLGVLVCLSDTAVAVRSDGWSLSILPHLGAGAFFAGLGWLCRRLAAACRAGSEVSGAASTPPP